MTTPTQTLAQNNGKKFDVCLMNPPYGTVGGDTLHLKFVDKILDIANKQVVIFPYSLITKSTNKVFDKYKEKISKYLTEVEEVNSNVFDSTHMPNVGIYTFLNDKKNDITIIPLNGEERHINSLTNISKFSDYEKTIIEYLEKQGRQLIYWCMGPSARTKALIGLNEKEQNKLKEQNFRKYIKNIKDFYDKQNGASLIVNDSNGGMNGTFMSSMVGQIFNNYDDIEKFFRSRKPSYNVLMFNNVKEAENCKIALQNPLLRFTIYRLQDDQHMIINKVYKYVPAIDWSNPKVKTDEGLLELCGCPKDKCKEYAEYCKKIIEKVDKK